MNTRKMILSKKNKQMNYTVCNTISYFSIPPDHELIQQIKLTLDDIYSIFPKIITGSSPWNLSSPVTFVKKQLKRTISLPLIGGIRKIRNEIV